MKVHDIMTEDVFTVAPDMPVGEVAHIMREYDYSGLPVIDEQRRLLGVITEMDLIARHARPHYPRYIQIMDTRIFLERPDKFNEELRRILAVTAEQIMTQDPPTASPDDDVEDVTTIMAERQFNPIPVVNEQDEVVGIIACHDLLEIIARPKEA